MVVLPPVISSRSVLLILLDTVLHMLHYCAYYYWAMNKTSHGLLVRV